MTSKNDEFRTKLSSMGYKLSTFGTKSSTLYGFIWSLRAMQLQGGYGSTSFGFWGGVSGVHAFDERFGGIVIRVGFGGGGPSLNVNVFTPTVSSHTNGF